MRVAIFQILMIQDMVKVEFKISLPDGHSTLVEKMINNQEDYEKFKTEVSNSITSLDDIISHQLKEKNHDNSGSNS